MTFTVSFANKHIIEVFILLGSLTALFKEAFYAISSPNLYFYSGRFESIFQLVSPNEPAMYMFAFPQQ